MGCFSSTSRSEKQADNREPNAFHQKEINREPNATKHTTTSTNGEIQRPGGIVRVFTFDEIKAATKNFSLSRIVGDGEFGVVYRGVLRSSLDGVPKRDVAVKRLAQDGGLQGHKEWVTKVNIVGMIEHPNLVKLIGYCAEEDKGGIRRILVYEYMPNNSVQHHLCSRFRAPLPWLARLKIAQDTARGLAHLHEGMDFQIIFEEFKSSSVLLDEELNAKLSDFGPAHEDDLDNISTAAVAGPIVYGAYAAPEHIQTGLSTSESNVWSFGVFIYELLTGRRPLDKNKPKNEQQLLSWVKPYLSDPQKLTVILDPRLQGSYSIGVACKLVRVANECLSSNSKKRPTMSKVVEMISEIVDSAETESLNHRSVKENNGCC